MLEYVRVNRHCAAAALWTPSIVLFLCLVAPSLSTAQDAKPADDRIKALERERDELKKRNGILELRLKQLQATVNKQITEALEPSLGDGISAAPPVPQPPGESSSSAAPVTVPTNPLTPPYWRPVAPPYSRFPGIGSLQSPVDVVGLAVAYQDALGEVQKSRRLRDAKENRPPAAPDPAESKVRLLRSITATLRDQVAGEVDRVRKLAAIHAVPVVDVRNLDARLKILDLILAQDPDAEPRTAPAGDKPAQHN
jgi:hypothetical protein